MRIGVIGVALLFCAVMVWGCEKKTEIGGLPEQPVNLVAAAGVAQSTSFKLSGSVTAFGGSASSEHFRLRGGVVISVPGTGQ